MQYAVAPIVPLILGVLTIGRVIYGLTKKTEGVKLGVIGMKGAGKTTFLSKLGIVPYSSGTSVDSYKYNTIHIGEREIHIASGEDIGGSVSWCKQYYQDWIEKKDIIVFIYNGNEYLSNKDYRRETRGRLDFLFQIYKNRKGDKEFKNVVIIASHCDLYAGNKTALYNKLKEDVQSRDYSKLFVCNYFVAKLSDNKSVKEIAKKIF